MQPSCFNSLAHGAKRLDTNPNSMKVGGHFLRNPTTNSICDGSYNSASAMPKLQLTAVLR